MARYTEPWRGKFPGFGVPGMAYGGGANLGIPGIPNLGFLPQNVLAPGSQQRGYEPWLMRGGGGRPPRIAPGLPGTHGVGADLPIPGGTRGVYAPWMEPMIPGLPIAPSPGLPGVGIGVPGVNSLSWLPRDILMPPGGFGYGNPRTERQAAREAARAQRRAARAAGGGLGRGSRTWGGGAGFMVSTPSVPPGAGTGSYFPGTGNEQAVFAHNQAQAIAQQSPFAKAALLRARMAGGGRGGAGGGAGGMGGLLGQLVGGFQGAQDAANRKNEERYQDILRGQLARWQQGLAALQGMGAQELADVNRMFADRAGQIDQDMVSRGLTNTTVRQQQHNANLEAQAAARNRINEGLRREWLAANSGLMGDLLNFMERREDVQPDFGPLMQLAQMLGASGLAGGQVQQNAGGGSPLTNLLAGGVDFAHPAEVGYNLPGPMLPGGFGGMVLRSNRTRQRRGPPLVLGTPRRRGVRPPRTIYRGGGVFDYGIGVPDTSPADMPIYG